MTLASPTNALAPVSELRSGPYPGLRPFGGNDAAWLFGRDRQVKEVVNRLRDTQFVAVMGGSGSGKSSLIQAGVVPDLRNLGLVDAGDFWVPIVCTPGTNGGEVKARQANSTPVTRLAWKFASLLVTRGSEVADAQRAEDIAALFRQDAGFTRLIEVYGSELATPTGPNPTDARLLFVIDQFEELFHPSNKDGDDARLLVERVIDHFFNPHERCYVVLSMRSEHLNDCASYLELPDAINKSSYLVRRLDSAELREAIIAPAQRFLRMLRRRKLGDSATLPAQIVFEPAMVERLLRDVEAISHDPDHLPLLQQILARVWNMACQREGVAVGCVPAVIAFSDLTCATLADNPRDAMLDPTLNVLRASLENWAEHVFSQTPPSQRGQVESIFRKLAVKDPNTGKYTQNRINVDDCATFLGPEATRDTLWALVGNGFVGTVAYLYWDADDLSCVTLKVSHESFIRGWPRFRELIDREAERFEEFMQVLRACARWKQGEKAESLLLEGAQLRNLHEAGLQAELKEPLRRSRWFRFLAFVRDGQRYRALEAVVDTFIMRSLQRDERQRHEAAMAERRQREMEISIATERAETAHAQLQAARAESEVAEAQAKNAYAKVLGRRQRQIILGNSLLLLVVVFWLAIEYPVRLRIEPFFAVLRSIGGVNVGLRGSSFSVAHDQLARGLRVVDDLGRGLSGTAGVLESDRPLGIKYLGWVPGIKGRREFFDNVSNLVEPRVNGTLRQLLTGYPWPVKGDAGTKWLSARVMRVNECTVASGAIGDPDGPGVSAASREKVNGTVYVANASVPSSGTPRALIVTDPTEWDQSWDIRPVMELKDDQCTVGPSIWRSPPEENRPAVAFDATLQYLLQLTFNPRAPPSQAGTISVTELSWLPGPSGSDWIVGSQPPVVLQDPAAVTALESVLDTKPRSRGVGLLAASSTADKLRSQHVALATASSTAGVLVKVVENQQWRLVATEASSIPSSLATQFAQKLGPEASTSACNRLREPVAKESKSRDPGFANVKIYPHGGYCFAVIRGTPSQGYTPSGYEAVRVSVYPPPLSAADDPQPIASMSFGFQPEAADRWLVAESGSYMGWIALDLSKDQKGSVLVGAPWSTAAVVTLGKELLSSAPNIDKSNDVPKSGVKK